MMDNTPSDRETVEPLAEVSEARVVKRRLVGGHPDDRRHHEDVVAATLRALAHERDAAVARAEAAEAARDRLLSAGNALSFAPQTCGADSLGLVAEIGAWQATVAAIKEGGE